MSYAEVVELCRALDQTALGVIKSDGRALLVPPPEQVGVQSRPGAVLRACAPCIRPLLLAICTHAFMKCDHKAQPCIPPKASPACAMQHWSWQSDQKAGALHAAGPRRVSLGAHPVSITRGRAGSAHAMNALVPCTALLFLQEISFEVGDQVIVLSEDYKVSMQRKQ